MTNRYKQAIKMIKIRKCVSITIIELNEFFKLADLSYIDKRTKLINLYNEFGIESPNTILFKKINDFANTLLK